MWFEMSFSKSTKTMMANICALLLLIAPTIIFSAPVLSPQQKILISYHVRAGYPFVTPSKWSILEPSASPLPVVEGNFPEDEFKWIINGDSLNISDYLNRQPITGLLIAKDGVLLYEKYQYNATQNSLFLSNSMAKSVVGIGIGMLREDGLITGFEDRAEKYLPELKDSNLGKISIKNLMRMGTGMRYRETNQPGDDHDRFGKAIQAGGLREALFSIKNNEQISPQGTIYNYAGFSSVTLGLILQERAKTNIAKYIEKHLWMPMGASTLAAWGEDKEGNNLGHAALLANGRDWLRLSLVLANDGVRSDLRKQIIPRKFIEETINENNLDRAFKPRVGSWGYANQFWIGGKQTQEYGLVGSYGQSIFISQKLNLVMIQFSVNETHGAEGTSLGKERNAFWRSLVKFYDR